MSAEPAPNRTNTNSNANLNSTTAAATGKPAGKQITNPAFRALGLTKIKLPSRNWLIFWTVLAASLSGIAYDKYQQRQIVNQYTERVKPYAQKPWPVDKLPRKITVFVAPPPDDYLETSLKVWRRFVKPILYYAGLDYNVVQEDSQGMIRSAVAEEIRKLRRERKERARVIMKEGQEMVKEGNASDAVSFQGEGGSTVTNDVRDVLGIFYERKKLENIVREDELVGDDQSYLSGGVICVGRGAYKEYIIGLHEGLLGPLDPPEPPKSSEHVDSGPDSSGEEIKEVSSEDALVPTASSKSNETSDDKVTDESSKEENSKTIIPRYIEPAQYAEAQFPPPEFSELDETHPIRDAETNVPILLHQPLLMISLPSLSGFLNIPRRIYRFYTRRHFVESVCEQTIRVVNEDPMRQFENPEDLKLGLAEEKDWPKSWVKRGLERKSEWTRDFVGDSRVTALMRTYNDKVPEDEEGNGVGSAE